jgi:hypothetical protein
MTDSSDDGKKMITRISNLSCVINCRDSFVGSPQPTQHPSLVLFEWP